MGLPGGFAALAGCGGGARAAGPVTVCERWRWGGGGIARDTGSCGAGCAWSGGTAPADHLDVEVRMIIRRAVPVYASSLIKVARCHLAAAGAPLAPLAPGGRAPAPLREGLDARLTDPRKPRGARHSPGPLVAVLVAGGRIVPSSAARSTARPGPQWAWTARNASSPRAAGAGRCTCWERSPTSPGW